MLNTYRNIPEFPAYLGPLLNVGNLDFHFPGTFGSFHLNSHKAPCGRPHLQDYVLRRFSPEFNTVLPYPRAFLIQEALIVKKGISSINSCHGCSTLNEFTVPVSIWMLADALVTPTPLRFGAHRREVAGIAG
jgi:hypothetical protein